MQLVRDLELTFNNYISHPKYDFVAMGSKYGLPSGEWDSSYWGHRVFPEGHVGTTPAFYDESRKSFLFLMEENTDAVAGAYKLGQDLRAYTPPDQAIRLGEDIIYSEFNRAGAGEHNTFAPLSMQWALAICEVGLGIGPKHRRIMDALKESSSETAQAIAMRVNDPKNSYKW